MREQRYFFQGSIVCVFLLWNLYSYNLFPSLQSISNESKSLALLIVVLFSIAISPGIGYLLYSLVHFCFLLLGGWSGFYKRNHISTLMQQAVRGLTTKSSKHYDSDVLASYIFCTKESESKYLEWIRRRMDVVFISSAIILYIFLIDGGSCLLFILMTHQFPLNYGRLGVLWSVSLFLILVLFFILIFEKKKAVEGFKFYFCRLVEADLENKVKA